MKMIIRSTNVICVARVFHPTGT
nr:unnamed protein product [Callosobruchus chinensis]